MGVYNIVAPVSTLSSPTNWNDTTRLDLPTSWRPAWFTEKLSKEVADKLSATEKLHAYWVWDKYRWHIKKASELANVPQSVILAFMLVESNGFKESADKNPTTPGLMQWNPNLAFEVIEKEKNKGRMSQAEEEFLSKYNIKMIKSGDKYIIGGDSVVTSGNQRHIKKATAIDPWLNIYVGAMYLGQYLDEPWGREANGDVRMDRIVARYNGGQGAFAKRSIGTKTTAQILADTTLPEVTKAYIRKVSGKNGSLDVAVNTLKIT